MNFMIRCVGPPDPAATIVFVNPTKTIPLPTLHPAPVVFDEGWLRVDGGHELHLRQSGDPRGIPALLLHGGPGSGGSPLLARFLDPARYRVIGVDQRGAGLSRPAGETARNTTADLLADLRRLREHLGVARWLVVGGSWGATLALAHAIDAPQAVGGLLLRNPFLARDADVDAFFAAAEAARPRRWSRWRRRAVQAGVPLLDLLAAWLDDGSVSRRRAAVRSWWLAEQELSSDAAAGTLPGPALLDALRPRYRIQAHYLRHRCWLDAPPLLDRLAALPRVPTLLLQGGEDRVCPPAGAAALRARLLHANLRIVEGAGHDPTHPAMVAAMRRALDGYAEHGGFDDGERAS